MKKNKYLLLLLPILSMVGLLPIRLFLFEPLGVWARAVAAIFAVLPYLIFAITTKNVHVTGKGRGTFRSLIASILLWTAAFLPAIPLYLLGKYTEIAVGYTAYSPFSYPGTSYFPAILLSGIVPVLIWEPVALSVSGACLPRKKRFGLFILLSLNAAMAIGEPFMAPSVILVSVVLFYIYERIGSLTSGVLLAMLSLIFATVYDRIIVRGGSGFSVSLHRIIGMLLIFSGFSSVILIIALPQIRKKRTFLLILCCTAVVLVLSGCAIVGFSV